MRDPDRRQFLASSAQAVIPSAKPVLEFKPRPLGPAVAVFWARHFDEAGSPRTLIVRSMAVDGPCHRCPPGMCSRVGRTCVVEAPGHVPYPKCAGYVLAANRVEPR